MFEVSIATSILLDPNDGMSRQTVWPVTFENVQDGNHDSTCAKIPQGRDVAQDLANALNKTLGDFLTKLDKQAAQKPAKPE